MSHQTHRIDAVSIPKQVVVVDELPRNTVGKVLKNELRASLTHDAKATA